MKVYSKKIGLWSAIPFWLSLIFVPSLAFALYLGGWWLLAFPVFVWTVYSILDILVGLDTENADPQTSDDRLFWYKLITLVWPPIQFVVIFGSIALATYWLEFTWWEKIFLMLGVGFATGTVGINYAHELMHQKNRLERILSDFLLAMVLYSHFRSEHLLVHHLYVGTPRDPVTARYNEGFYRFFPRVLVGCLVSAWRADKAMLARRDLPYWYYKNPFYEYAALQSAMLFLAYAIGGWAGIGMFVLQAFVAVWQLEAVNYVEHYGLTRKHFGEGKYEYVRPLHSWNAAHRVSNWLLINLQRHSDHHYRPNRRFPLLQNYDKADAPQLPYGYPTMILLAMFPRKFRRIMNPRVRQWRSMYYPEISNWDKYRQATNPIPKGAS